MAFTPQRNPASFNFFRTVNLSAGVEAPGSSIFVIFSFVVETETERITPRFRVSLRSAGRIAVLSISFSNSMSLRISVDFVLIKTGKRYFNNNFSMPSVSFNFSS
jgi:hypothetical protein